MGALLCTKRHDAPCNGDAKQRIYRKVINKKVQNFTPKVIAWRRQHDQGVKKEQRF